MIPLHRHISTSLLILLLLTAAGGDCAANDFTSSLPSLSPLYQGYHDTDSIASRMSERAMSDLEGVWRMAGNGALIAIERYSDPSAPVSGMETYRMVMVESPRRHPRPGTLVGYIGATAARGKYDASIYTTVNDALRLEMPRNFILELTDDTHLTFTPVKSGIRVNLWRLVPYLFRFSISVGNNRPAGLDGAVKVWPEGDAPPSTPRYL